jgi:proteic killer suppression protein
LILSFKDSDTEAVFNDERPKRFPSDIIKAARRKLVMLHTAKDLNDRRAVPGHKLHPLYRERAGQHAIWINRQWRVCFRWTDAGPEDVEITDYHD